MALVSLNRLRSLDANGGGALQPVLALPDFAIGGDPARARDILSTFCSGRWRSYVES